MADGLRHARNAGRRDGRRLVRSPFPRPATCRIPKEIADSAAITVHDIATIELLTLAKRDTELRADELTIAIRSIDEIDVVGQAIYVVRATIGTIYDRPSEPAMI